MEQKNDENKEIGKNKENAITEEGKKEKEEKKEKETKKVKEIKKPSAWIFFYGDNLQGFHIAFILMIIIPITIFFIIRNMLAKYNFNKSQQDVFGVIGVLISVWFILISFAIYYFRDDFYTVFCKKKENDNKKEKSE